MRVYNEISGQLEKIFCNQCGKNIRVVNGIAREEVQKIEIKWSYFSQNDGKIMQFDLCEECINNMKNNFAIEPTEKENVELI